MKKITRTLSASIVIAIVLAYLLATAASDGGAKIASFSVFALCAMAAFAINWLAFIPAYMAKTEHYYDLTGSITYIFVIGLAVSASGKLDMRAVLVSGMVVIWALRLGTFLFSRIQRDGKDDRFDDIKHHALRFFLTWTLQALWVVFTAACALVIITNTNRVPMEVFGIIGALVWVSGFVIEVVADRQKSAFKRDESNAGKFISSGLWSWSRHPNYFGEMVLWFGVAIMALPVMQGWQWAALISPIFVYLLITHISGVNKLEQKADEKWGNDPDYQRYKSTTSSLVLLPPKTSE